MFFVDTNVPLGYTIMHDKHHESSNKFITNNKNIFWSNLVQKEYIEKLDNIIDDIDMFLKLTEKVLKNNHEDFLSYYAFERYILKRTRRCTLDKIKKQKILEHFWTKYNITEGIAENVYLKFEKFNKNFKKMYFKRDKKLNEILILHDCGLNNYSRYLDYVRRLKEWGIHSPDCKIITDAHDCGLSHNNLVFVSADMDMLEKIAAHDTSFLEIIEFRSCN